MSDAAAELEPTRVRVTVWSDAGATAAYDHPKTRALLDAARPQILTLHADPAALASDAGLRLTQRVRRDHPDAEVWHAWQGDGHGPDPSAVWARAAAAAEAMGVPVVEPNCESGWKRKRGRPAGTMRRALLAVRAAATRTTIGFTSFSSPVSIFLGTFLGIRRYWGYGGDFTWREALGEGSPVAWCAWQDYAVPRLRRATRADHLVYYDRATQSRDAAEHQGLVRPGLPRHEYLQAAGGDTSGLVTLAEHAPVAAFWCAPGELDAQGIAAIRALCELHRRGLRLRAFQRAAGLAQDSICGPKTLAALGIAP